ncbi:LuxR C-terminal-related transcriptional regulator, partial [Bacillus safensis]
AHLTNIYQKLNVTSRAEAIKTSIELGIIHF